MHLPRPEKKTKLLKAANQGFALIISLGLMAFVVLLILTISTLVQVETSASKTTKSILVARQNAQLALFQAIGELQKYAGPDQRISASASILDTNPSTAAIDGYTNVQNWTGIWDATYPTNSAGDPISIRSSGNADLDAYLDTSSRTSNRLLKLLVSGDQDLSDAAAYTPDSANDVLLLSNSTDTTKEVYAPKAPIKGSSNNTLGNYAYWVADEGVKAKFNIRDTHLKDGGSDERQYSFLTAQRSGIENMDAVIGLNFPTNEIALEKLGSNAELAVQMDVTTVSENSFHDLTAYSLGLLTDTKHGGLKKDLTWFFERPESDAIPTSLQDVSFYNSTSYFNITEPRMADFPQASNAFCEPGPTWNKLRSFYQLKDKYTNGIVPQPHGETTYGIGPIAIRSILGVIPEIRTVGTDLYFRAHLDFQVVLWNPYNVTLAPHVYEVEFMNAGSSMVLYPEFVFDESVTGDSSDAPQTYPNWPNYAYYPNSRVAQHGNNNQNGAVSESIDGVFQHQEMSSFRDELGKDIAGVIFKTPLITFEPGQVVLLTIDNDSDEAYMEGYELSIGENGGSVYLDYPNPLPAIVSNGVTQTDAITGATEQFYPKFKWRQWRSWGPSDPALSSSNPGSGVDIGNPAPFGEVRSFALREPLVAGESRDLKDNSNDLILENRFTYYSRLFRENYGNATANSVWNLTHRVSGEIASDAGGGTRVLETDWSNGPNFSAKFEFGARMYEFDLGPTINSFERPPPFLLRNPLAVDSRIDGTEAGSFAGGYVYAVIGWTSAPKYPNYGSPTTIDSDAGNAYFGNTYSATGSHFVPLADAPKQDEPILSMGYFQHANLYRFDTAPAFQIGNSFAETRLLTPTDLTRISPYGDSDNGYNMLSETQSVIDSTYLLNDALWDRFFLSTYSDPTNINDTNFTPPNARMARTDPEGIVSTKAINDFFDVAAAHLAVNGAFNVNSTSIDAWKATLGSLSDLNINPKTGDLDTTRDRVVSHFSSPENLLDDSVKNDLWTGFRTLTDQQLAALAEAMVEQVKIRGPFLSMAEFVNRRLANDATGYRGALQAAIDSLDYTKDDNNKLSTAATSINYNTAMTFGGETNLTTDGTTGGGLPPTYPIPEAGRAHHYTGMPGWVTQGDILQPLAPSLTVRSDTFRIRAYGENLDPLTNTVQSSAWCEAIVQRVAEPVSPLATNTDSPDDYEPNDAFGRKFKIIAFHWLSPEEI